MGQQQLLLVILVTIIVGIATVVAINTFGSAADNANVSAVQQDLLQMSAAAQSYYMEPTMMGGGGNTFSGISWGDMGAVPTDSISGGVAFNQNGSYDISDISDSSFVITGMPGTAGGSVAIRVCADDAAMGDYDAASTSASAPSDCN